MKKLLNWIIPAVFGIGLWFIPTPEGLTPQSWHLFAIFVATIVGFITQPLPIGGVSIVVITVAALTGTLKIGEAISGFANSAIWLIVGAFLFSRGFIKTGLGKRIAYNLIAAFGSSSLRLSYALALSDLILAPAHHLIQLVWAVLSCQLRQVWQKRSALNHKMVLVRLVPS